MVRTYHRDWCTGVDFEWWGTIWGTLIGGWEQQSHRQLRVAWDSDIYSMPTERTAKIPPSHPQTCKFFFVNLWPIFHIVLSPMFWCLGDVNDMMRVNPVYVALTSSCPVLLPSTAVITAWGCDSYPHNLSDAALSSYEGKAMGPPHKFYTPQHHDWISIINQWAGQCQAPSYGLVASLNISNIEKLIITYAVNKTINKTDFMCRGSQSSMDKENILEALMR